MTEKEQQIQTNTELNFAKKRYQSRYNNRLFNKIINMNMCFAFTET